MNVNLTYIGVLNILESFSAQHIGVKRFISDFEEQLGIMTSEGEDFPVIFVSPSFNIYDDTITSYSIRVWCYDRYQKDRSNVGSVLSQCNQILNDMYVWLRDIESSPIDIDSTFTSYPINNWALDFLGGYYMDIVIRVASYGDCQIPFIEAPVITGFQCNIPYTNQYLTCDDLTGCPVIEDIQDDIDNLTLNDLTDVVITGATAGEALIYNGTDWVNQSIPTPINSLSGLSDVSITGVTAGEALIYNGTDWVNDVIPIPELEDLTDVIITGATAGEALLFNGTDWVNGPVATSSESTLGIVFNGFGGVIQAVDYPLLYVPFNCTINEWSLIGNTTGNLEIDIWRLNGAIPTILDTIVASNYPNLTAQQINSDSTLTGWSVNLLAGDIIKFVVNSATTISSATLTLKITK